MQVLLVTIRSQFWLTHFLGCFGLLSTAAPVQCVVGALPAAAAIERFVVPATAIIQRFVVSAAAVIEHFVGPAAPALDSVF
jgi:hypothetical protein